MTNPNTNETTAVGHKDQHHKTKPPPKPDQAWAAQSRLACSTFWVGSALFCLAFPTLYPTGKKDALAGMHTGRVVGASVTQFLDLFPLYSYNA